MNKPPPTQLNDKTNTKQIRKAEISRVGIKSTSPHQQQHDHDDHDQPDHQSLPGNVSPLVSIGSSLLSTGGISGEVPGGRFILSTTNFSLICYLCQERFTLWGASTSLITYYSSQWSGVHEDDAIWPGGGGRGGGEGAGQGDQDHQ